ncbi:class I SAM-dependent methyltransferase [Nitrosomonadales bacterium]|nr:class I SAM-dependent methyltransferase [Nitrosomonadales bacterium]
MKNTIINQIRALNVRRSELWINEAKFGFGCLSEYCKKIRKNSKVLEVGCGSGILLAMLTQKFDGLMFEGIEPFGSGFNSLLELKELNMIVKDNNVSIKNVSYEKFNPRIKYDLIYCVNVFEHLNDWRKFLLLATEWLSKDGKIVILCPNYGFPYESHFNIPVIINKSLTFSIFKKSIIKQEKDMRIEGTWKSLNLVKKKEVLHFIKSKPSLELFDDISIIDIIIKRFMNNREFRERQRLMGAIAVFVQKIGLLKILKLFPTILPYMKLEVRRVEQIK